MDYVLIGEILAGLMFFGVIGMLMLGFPVAFSLAGTSLIFGAIGYYLEVFDFSNLASLAGRYIGFMTNELGYITINTLRILYAKISGKKLD